MFQELDLQKKWQFQDHKDTPKKAQSKSLNFGGI